MYQYELFTRKKYQIVYADPPWAYNDKGCNGNCESHYATLSIDDLCSLKVNQICDDNAILFLWTTYPMLIESLTLIKAWGFMYKSIGFQWLKLNKKNGKPFYGLGRWTRGNTEPCLIAVKGKPSRQSSGVFQLIQEPIAGHSKKPDCTRDKIVQLMGDLPRIELFARSKTPGWDCVGNEIDGKDIRQALDDIITDQITISTI